MILRSIEKCFSLASSKGWDKTYWAFDIHGTIVRPNYQPGKISTVFYPEAKEVMQMLSTRKDVIRILYTCSYPHEIEQYLAYFSEHGIHFDYVNQNPEIACGAYGYYEDKFYFNVLFDDKAGFDGETDWKLIKDFMRSVPLPAVEEQRKLS
jgi:hypothetical protein